jgi:hypothetical protein
MVEYRAYIIGDNGRFKKAVDLDCQDDESAKEKAEALVDGHDVELWQLGRLIERFKRKSE